MASLKAQTRQDFEGITAHVLKDVTEQRLCSEDYLQKMDVKMKTGNYSHRRAFRENAFQECWSSDRQSQQTGGYEEWPPVPLTQTIALSLSLTLALSLALTWTQTQNTNPVPNLNPSPNLGPILTLALTLENSGKVSKFAKNDI